MSFELRPLEQGDFSRGFLETLENLVPVKLTVEEAIHIWRGRNAAGVRTVVAVEGDQVIGTATLILEHKFLHRGGTIGHIEDVAVHPAHEGKGVGRAVVKSLVDTARQSGCYKVILSCNDQNLAFYQKLGFRRHDNGMRIDLI
ncbi:MAG TPA: GNAT family N-acetyltransferase [Gemmataceae bacterium]|jgi:glucosamine-phosphate N-acetyltransferase|nr:GNAT family N-acetyltransferase [Gemmataceae bacterium]